MAHMVSILVPVYNASQWLRQCLDSIVGQTYDNLQVVLVDDGSTDDSLAICREYAERYPFVEVYHQENKGVAAARNSLLDRVRGEYVLFVDADDWIEPNAVEVMTQLAEKHNARVVVCGNKIGDECGSTCCDEVDERCEIWERDYVIKEFLRHTIFRGQLWNKLIQRELFDGKAFNHKIGYGEDADILWKILLGVDKIVWSNIPLYNYRISVSSISGQRFSAKKMHALNVWQKICADVEICYPQYIDIAKSRYGVEAVCLLYNAMRTNPDVKSVRILRDTIRPLLPYMRQCDFVSVKMYLFAWVAVRSCRLAKMFV